MRDKWYGDNRDLVKWGVLLHLAESFNVTRIIQLAYYRPSEFGHLIIDGQEQDIPPKVMCHFRNLRNITSINSDVRVTVFNPILDNRETHIQAILSLLSGFDKERCIVFLDPDTGLEPLQRPTLNHVLESEAKEIWKEIKHGDMFAFYQHQTNRAGQPWIESKREQLAKALKIDDSKIKVASGPSIANDVVIFFVNKA